MMISHPMFSKVIELSNCKVNILTIENHNIFFKIVDDFYNMSCGYETEFKFFEGDKNFIFDKVFDFVPSVVMLNPNNKSILNKLYSNLKLYAIDGENIEKSIELSNLIKGFVYELADKLDYDIDMSENIDWNVVFKALGVEVSIQDAASLCEKIIAYTDIYSSILGNRYFTFVNLKDYINDSEYAKLCETMIVKNRHLLLIESKETALQEFEKRVIIDNDLDILT